MPGSSLYGIYLLSIGVSLVGNLVLRLGARGGPDLVLTPAILVAVGIAIARRRYA